MGLEDLELEFEDEEELGKSPGEAVKVDVDLSFNTSNEEQAPRGNSIGKSSNINPKKNENTNILNHPKNQTRSQIVPKAIITNPKINVENRSNQESELRNKIMRLEAEKKLLVAIVSDAKLMDYKITRVLLKIHNHHPELKKDGQQIKRYLNEFLKELEKF